MVKHDCPQNRNPRALIWTLARTLDAINKQIDGAETRRRDFDIALSAVQHRPGPLG
jgi:hypothetical protein